MPQKRREYAPRMPADQRRDQLLDAALHLVVTRGHPAVTMESVAEQAGVTKPVVYGQFADRGQLLAALLRREHEQALAQLLTLLPPDLDRLRDEPADVLGVLLTQFLLAVRSAPERWHCVVMPMPDMPAQFHAAREQARAVALARTEELARWLLRASAIPEELDAEIVAHSVVSLCEMAARLVLADPAHFAPDRFVAALRAAVGLLPG